MAARSINWDEIPDSTLLPQDLYTFEVDDLTEETSKKGKLMYRAVFRVTDGNYTGTPLYDYFSIGSDEDPTASEPSTWTNSIGARRMKRLFKATQIPMTSDIDEMVENVKQQRFVASVAQEMDDGLRDPKYKGVKRNRIDGMFPLGTRIAGGNGPAVAPPAPAPAPARAAAPPKPAPAAGARAAKPAAIPTVTCPYCKAAIARNGYMQHVTEQHPDEAN
jgi:hypothetical protein